MSGDPRVLAPLQHAFNAADNAHVRQAIIYAWEFETDTRSTVQPRIDKRIRAWTPPPAEPSLEQRVAALEELKNRIDAMLFEESEPECTKCGGTGHTRENCKPAPQPAPDLDPVRVEAAAKAALESRVSLKWSEVSEMTRKTYMWDAEIAIRAYLKDGGA